MGHKYVCVSCCNVGLSSRRKVVKCRACKKIYTPSTRQCSYPRRTCSNYRAWINIKVIKQIPIHSPPLSVVRIVLPKRGPIFLINRVTEKQGRKEEMEEEVNVKKESST